jgi:hypothetical protein
MCQLWNLPEILMLKQHQLFAHDPENGIFGDCHRTCIASILGIPQVNVPNFGVHYEDGPAFSKAVREYLDSRNLVEVNIAFTGSTPMQEILNSRESLAPGVMFIFSGESERGCDHSVVAGCGQILMDPHPDESGLIGPCGDGLWWATYLTPKSFVFRPQVDEPRVSYGGILSDSSIGNLTVN